MLSGRRILLIIGGGIAAYKSLELIRLLTKAGAGVVPVLTAGGAEFVTPLTVSALAGERVHSALFDLTAEAEMGHIELSRAAGSQHRHDPGAGLLQQADELEALVGGDAAADDQQYPPAAQHLVPGSCRATAAPGQSRGADRTRQARAARP